jgi:hypothetical protein
VVGLLRMTNLKETKDSSSADHYLPSNKVRGWPPQNDKPYYVVSTLT